MMAPWLQRQLEDLLARPGHAWLLQGPSGLGQYELGLAMVRAWLCERPTEQGACGACESCHALAVHTHADLCVLMPETIMLELGWPLSEKAQQDIDDKKRKPSKEIRIDAMRDAVEFAQRTSARGRGKTILVFPAERMNHITANALLKTLEEPPGEMRFVLASEASHQLLPTIRSRCLTHTLIWPEAAEALAWLHAENIAPALANAMLQAAGGRPDDALRYARAGIDPKAWALWPKALARGDRAAMPDWSSGEAVNELQKLCHDLLAVRVGAVPRFFDAAALPPSPALATLGAWSRELVRVSRTVEHPFNPGLMLEALLNEGHRVLRLP